MQVAQWAFSWSNNLHISTAYKTNNVIRIALLRRATGGKNALLKIELNCICIGLHRNSLLWVVTAIKWSASWLASKGDGSLICNSISLQSFTLNFWAARAKVSKQRHCCCLQLAICYLLLILIVIVALLFLFRLQKSCFNVSCCCYCIQTI